ncbi:MAG: peroxiredoxin [Chloroflexi bacterium]|nr:peroxiredoxin [Chloroflexota bacterium]
MPQIGQPVPDFELPNQDGQRIRLSDYRGQKVVVFVFPKAYTGGCNAQACGFRDEFPRFEEANAVVLGISADSPETLKRWKQDKKLPYDLLSDPDYRVQKAWQARGLSLLNIVDLPITVRSYWVINEDGIVTDMQVGTLPTASVKKALAAVEGSAAKAG